MAVSYDDPIYSRNVDETSFSNPFKGVRYIAVKRSYPTPHQKSNKMTKIMYAENPSKDLAAPSKSLCNCDLNLCGSPTRLCMCGPELIWILLLGLVLCLAVAAIIITIIVGLQSTSPTSSPCVSTYSQSFTNGANSANQCTAWSAFLANLTCSTYLTVHMYGSIDTTGIVITDSTVATALATALRTSTAYTGVGNGYTMKVGGCGGGYEITSSGTVCSCNVGYIIRPCIGGANWGGLGGTVCGAQTQTMTLYFG